MALTEEEKLALVLVLAVLMFFVVYFELRIMRGKAKDVRRVGMRKDEAHNAILTCQSVMNVLERQGTNVREARALVEKARMHVQRGDHETAIDLCEDAREELTRVRTKKMAPAPAAEAPDERDELRSVAEDIMSSPPSKRRDDSYAGSRLEVQGGPNYLVAKFELNTAREEIDKAAESGRDMSKASSMLGKAQAEFDSGNYAKALSMAVKVKKSVSPHASEETIPLRSSGRTEPPTPEIDGEAGDVVDVCSSCGSELDSDDRFCGSCGATRTRTVTCGQCGRVASGSDKFCRKCGSRL